MRIALNLHFLRPQVTGGGETYAIELLRALAAIDDYNEYHLLCNRAFTKLDLPEQENFRITSSPVSASLRPVRYAWEQVVMPTQLKRLRPDVVHSLGYVAPVLSRLTQVVTIPDANWEELQTLSFPKRRALGFFVRRSAMVAEVIVTGTRAASAALSRYLPADRGRIIVVPLGADHLPEPVAQDSKFSDPYLLALSSSLDHKNIPRLVEAFARVAPQIPHSLVIAGHAPTEIRGAITNMGLDNRVQCSGYVNNQTLASLYAGADLFMFPSWHEGFGLPLLEAQRFGTPVAAARIAALVEIASGTAELFDPFSIDSIASAVLSVLQAPQRRKTLAEAARQNAARYTWAATARAMLKVYEELASGHGRKISR